MQFLGGVSPLPPLRPMLRSCHFRGRSSAALRSFHVAVGAAGCAAAPRAGNLAVIGPFLRQRLDCGGAGGSFRVGVRFTSSSPAPALAPPRLEGVTVVSTVQEARRVVRLMHALPPETFHAWDTETSELDLDVQSPVGNGRVICASAYCGPHVDFGSGPLVWIPNLDATEVRTRRQLCATRLWRFAGSLRHFASVLRRDVGFLCFLAAGLLLS